MKKIGFALLFLMFSCCIFSQEQTTNWAFGNNAGLTFDIETGDVTPTETAINTTEGCSSISDTDGNLLFYTDGRTVWSGRHILNGQHQPMLNGNYSEGTGLLGDPSSTSSGVIIPHPTNSNLYYIFTVDEPHHNNAWASLYNVDAPADQNGNPLDLYAETYPDFQSVPNDDDGFNNGLNYFLVDMSLNGGFGDVDSNEKNEHLITYDTSNQDQSLYKCSEKITAVQGSDCESIWVITHFIDKFYSFKIDDSGFAGLAEDTQDPLPPTITTQGYRRNGIGYMKSSPDGTKIAVCHAQNINLPSDDNASPNTGSFWLYDFDNETGLVSNPVNLISNVQCYGTEFSSDSKKVYVTTGNTVRQFDLENNNQQTIVHQGAQFISSMQLAPNNKIYVCNQENVNTLDVIEKPNEPGGLCEYTEFAQPLANGTQANLGLPPFITSFFGSQIDIIQNGISTTELKLCTGDSYPLEATDIVGADYVWSFDGDLLTETSSQLFVDTPGFYEVYIEPNNGDCPIEGSAIVGVFEIPVANLPSIVSACDELDNDGFTNFDFTYKNPEALLLQDPLIYNVSYFETEADANSGENKITFPYTNISNPQPIFVRVENSENINCFDVNSFNLRVFTTPQIGELNTIEFCDNFGDAADGIAITALGDLISTIRGLQDAAETAITFHSSQDDADENSDALPLNYTNTAAFNDTIFVRIQNTAKTDCYNTDSFDVIINPIPIANDVSLLQCDEDGIPEGFTTYNLIEVSEAVTGGNPDSSVEYYLSQIDADNETNPIDGNSFNNFFNPQIIYARVTNTTSDCINFSEISLEVSTTSSNNTSLELCDTDGTEDGFMNFNLTEANNTVLAGAPTGLDLIYYETYENALLETNSIGTTFTNTIPYNQTIYGRVENANACYGISEIELTVFELPNIETESETLYCLNFFPEIIVLYGGIIEDSPSNYYYEWSTGENTSEIEVNAPGTYNVRITNTNGCFKDRTITVFPSNIASITQIEVIDASQNNSISVFVTGDGDYEYALDDINGPYQDSNTFNNVQPGLYTVFVRDKNNCGIVEDLVSVIGFPKFFTPNNDDANDFWQIYGITNQFQANSTVYIFNRYGKLLIELDPLSRGWDGTYNGEKMPTSDYWFKVTLEDGRIFTNHFTLKR